MVWFNSAESPERQRRSTHGARYLHFQKQGFQFFFFLLLSQEYLWNIHQSATKQHRCVKHGPVINNPKLAEDEGDSERAQKLFCFALKQNSDTVGEENQSSQPRERERARGRRNENRERLWLLWWT